MSLLCPAHETTHLLKWPAWIRNGHGIEGVPLADAVRVDSSIRLPGTVVGTISVLR